MGKQEDIFNSQHLICMRKKQDYWYFVSINGAKFANLITLIPTNKLGTKLQRGEFQHQQVGQYCWQDISPWGITYTVPSVRRILPPNFTTNLVLFVKFLGISIWKGRKYTDCCCKQGSTNAIGKAKLVVSTHTSTPRCKPPIRLAFLPPLRAMYNFPGVLVLHVKLVQNREETSTLTISGLAVEPLALQHICRKSTEVNTREWRFALPKIGGFLLLKQ